MAISIKSSKPSKQRKFLYNAPLHIKHRRLAGHLSKELREKYKRRSLPIRKNDTVKIMRGKFKGKEGVVTAVDVKRCRIYVSGVVIRKTNGREVPVPIHPSNCLITDLYLEDKMRMRILKRKLPESQVTTSESETKETKSEQTKETK